MRDRQQCNILSKLGTKRLLDDRVRLIVWSPSDPSQQLHLALKRMTLTNGRRRLVKDEELASAHDRPRERKDLALSHGQVRPTARDLAVERDP